MATRAAGLDGEPVSRQSGARGGEVVVHAHRGELVVVEPGAAHRFTVETETDWLDEMQSGAGVRREPDQIAGVGRNLRLEEDQVKHELTVLRRTFRFSRCGCAVPQR